MNLQIDIKRFYRIGKYMFFVNFIVAVIRTIDLWNQLQAYSKVGSIASTIFQFALFGFFSYLLKKQDNIELNDGDIFKMNDALDKLKLGGKNGKKI